MTDLHNFTWDLAEHRAAVQSRMQWAKAWSEYHHAPQSTALVTSLKVGKFLHQTGYVPKQRAIHFHWYENRVLRHLWPL